MQRKVARLAHFRLDDVEGVGHAHMGEDQPHDVDERAAGKAIDDWIDEGSFFSFGGN
jgi:hypothetical protein